MSEDKSKPFEIRKDVLHLAKDIISENVHMKNNHARQDPRKTFEVLTYSTDDVLKEAEKLYSFISKR